MSGIAVEIERQLRAITLSPHHLIIAKRIAYEVAKAKRGAVGSCEIVKRVLGDNGAPESGSLSIGDGEGTDNNVRRCVDFLTWAVAAREAILDLVGAGTLVELRERHQYKIEVKYSTGSFSSQWYFPEFDAPIPYEVRLAESRRGDDCFMYDAGLYLTLLQSPGMHADVSAAFREAIKCFRLELYSASLAMLGKASEGAWLELGSSLVRLADKRGSASFEKHKQALNNPMAGVKKKIDSVCNYYRDQVTFADIGAGTGIRPEELGIVAEWSDVVRDSRNTIHFGVSSVTPNTFEKVSALLLGAPKHIRVLYRIKSEVDSKLP